MNWHPFTLTDGTARLIARECGKEHDMAKPGSPSKPGPKSKKRKAAQASAVRRWDAMLRKLDRPRGPAHTHQGKVVTRPGGKTDIEIRHTSNNNIIVFSNQGYENRRECEDQLIGIGLAFINGTIALHGRVKLEIEAARERLTDKGVD